MGLLDAVAGGGALGMIPGANMLAVVAKGLEMIKDLIDKGNANGADAVLKFLTDVLNELPKDASPAAEPQPFTPPPSVSSGAGGGIGQSAMLGMQVEVTMKPLSTVMLSHGTLPTVDGSPQGDQMLSDAARPFVEGSDAAKNRALTPGSTEWTSVMWAMQQNPNIQYDADNQRFFVQTTDTTKLDVCSLQDVQSLVMERGGFDRGNPGAATAVGEMLKNKIGDTQGSAASASIAVDVVKAFNLSGSTSSEFLREDLHSRYDELKKRLSALEAAHHVINPGSSMTIALGR